MSTMKAVSQARSYFEMKREGRLPAPGLTELQNRRLRALMAWAGERVPFYRELFEARGVRPDEIRSASDLDRVSVTTKAQMQAAALDRVMARGILPGRCVSLTTSGATGFPLRLYFTRDDFTRSNMNWLRPQLAWGVRPRDAQMEITGPHNILAQKTWYQKIGAWKREQISVFRPVEDWVALWNRLRPEVLYGYSGSLRLLALHCLDFGPLVPRPKFVIGVSDLSSEEDREVIRRAFGCELIDIYGAAETGCLAWYCRDCKSYHLNSDTVIVQVCRDGKPVPAGQSGNIIVTNLLSRAMPIIRYDLGDIGRLSDRPPSCGRSLPLMEIVEGRADSVLRLPSGRLLSPMFFYGVMKPARDVRAWRIVQEENGALTVLAVPRPDAPPEWPASLKRHIEERLGEKTIVEVVPVASIPPDASGKVRAVISKMSAKKAERP
jgi:phenylacetate-CoA ligase